MLLVPRCDILRLIYITPNGQGNDPSIYSETSFTGVDMASERIGVSISISAQDLLKNRART